MILVLASVSFPTFYLFLMMFGGGPVTSQTISPVTSYIQQKVEEFSKGNENETAIYFKQIFNENHGTRTNKQS